MDSTAPERPAAGVSGVRAGRTWLGLAGLVLAAALWSLNGPLIKVLDQQGVSPLVVACYRSLLGGLIFLPFGWRQRATLRWAAPAWPIASVALFTLMTVSFVIATTQTAASNAIILQYTSPLWVFVLSPLLLREKPGRVEGLGLLVAMAGVGIIFAGNRDGNVLGLVIALTSGFGYGALTVALRGLRFVHPTVVVTLNMLGSGLVLAIPVAIWARFDLTPAQWGLMVFMGVVQFSVPYAIFSWSLRYVEAHQAALIVLLEAALNPLWTYLAVGEVIPPATRIGGPLILLGVAGWIVLRWRSSPRTPSHDQKVQ